MQLVYIEFDAVVGPLACHACQSECQTGSILLTVCICVRMLFTLVGFAPKLIHITYTRKGCIIVVDLIAATQVTSKRIYGSVSCPACNYIAAREILSMEKIQVQLHILQQ